MTVELYLKCRLFLQIDTSLRIMFLAYLFRTWSCFVCHSLPSYVKHWNCVYARLQLDNAYTNLYQTWRAYAVIQVRYFREVKLSKMFLNSNPGEGASSSSETKHDRRPVPGRCYLFRWGD
jgi:hypothetical protein